MDDQIRKKFFQLKNDWKTLTPDQRIDEMRDIANNHATSQGIEAYKKFDAIPMHPDYRGEYDRDRHELHLNRSLFEDDNNPYQPIESTLHESRHAYQYKATQAPGFHKNEAEVKQWKEEFDNYISPSESRERYRKQKTETDSRNYAESEMKNLGLKEEHEKYKAEEKTQIDAFIKEQSEKDEQSKSVSEQENPIKKPEEKKEEEGEDYGMGM